MKVDLCALADFASSGEGGKLNIIGVFDTVGVSQFPAKHPLMVVVLRLLAEFDDSESQHEIRVVLEKPNGEKVFEVHGKVGIGTIEPGQFRTHNQVITLNQMPLETSGEHTFRVYIDGEQQVEKRLRVIKRG